MELALTLVGWQFSMMLARQKNQKPDPRLILPTEEEIKEMTKECYRRFGEAIKKQK